MGLVSQQSSVSGLEYWSQLGMLSGSGGIEVPKPVPRNQLQRPQIWPPLRCPRCDSANTKFCYYNNYSRSQPRYLCKACRRHWTEGGTLRNVPVGGGRKNKRNKATTSKAAAATTATATATAAATTAAATAINSSSIDDPATTIFPEILRRVLLRSPPPLLPPVASAGYGIMSTLMGSLQSDQIGNITAEPNTTVSSYGSALAQVSFFGYSDEGLGVMSSASNAWHVAPHAQPPPASSGGGEAVAAAPEASATTASGFWMSGWPDEEVSELDPSLTGDDL